MVEPPKHTTLSTQSGCLLRINVGPAEDGVVTIAVAGELDLATAPLIGATFHRLNSAQPLHVHLDLSGVNFCDAAGLNAFLAADRLLRATSGRLTLIRPSPQIRRLLTITKLDQILAID
jgi:anti-sigma B factor antagonist